MLSENLSLAYVIVWSLALANVLGAGACVLLSPHVAKLTRIPYGLLAPFMLMIIFFAVFQAGRQMEDILTLVVLGGAAILMKRNGWSRPALLVGFVLSDSVETYLYQAVQFYGAGFFLRPGALAILFLAILAVGSAMHYHKNLRPEQSVDESEITAMSGAADWRLGLAAAAFFAVALLDSLRHSFLGGVFPMLVSSAMLVVCIFLLARLRKKRGAHATTPKLADDFRSLAWVAWFGVLTAALGFVLALPVFFVMLMRNRSAASGMQIAALTAGGMAFILAVAHFARMDFPWGILQHLIDLPWPLG